VDREKRSHMALVSNMPDSGYAVRRAVKINAEDVIRVQA
jgi:hypothetical protein